MLLYIYFVEKEFKKLSSKLSTEEVNALMKKVIGIFLNWRKMT